MRKAGRFNPEKFSQLITPNFPPVKFAFGYGSAFFQQKNYQYDKKQPVFDIIFVVEDRVDWHKDNMANNRKHYGGLSYVFGPKFINFIQNALCPIHYNPFVMLDEYKIKYGVISEKDFKRDLLRWETLIVSGRMHKPVQKLIENEDYSETIQKNLQSAVAAALLVDGRTSIHDKELFMNIASLSYLGDIRFTLKGENKDKIANIVEGQYDQLRELYHPILKAAPFKDIVKVHDENFLFPKYTPESRHALIEMLPRGFGSEFVGENMDFKQSLMMRKDEQRDIIKEVISDLNSKNSRNMLLYHLLTVSPLKNAVYALEKLKKGRAKNP